MMLSAPEYCPQGREGLCKLHLAVEDMSRHMTDEGWQFSLGLQSAGYSLAGHKCAIPYTDVKRVLGEYDPKIVVVQDKREWTGRTAGRGQDSRYLFTNVPELAERSDIFKVGVIKDAHSDHGLHMESASEMGTHAWVTYYNVKEIARQAPFLRPQHIIRTYHTVNLDDVPVFNLTKRRDAVLTGAHHPRVYPLRGRIRSAAATIPELDVVRHPGYHRHGAATPGFLQLLAGYKVAICTSSVYKYALRKIIEATAAGCVVITDLPYEDKLPHIDDNLIRVSPTISMSLLRDKIQSACADYSLARQHHWHTQAINHYNYRVQGLSLAVKIERLRRQYNESIDRVESPEDSRRLSGTHD